MIYKLRKNTEFRLVYRRGKSYANNLLVLYVFKNKINSIRAALCGLFSANAGILRRIY